MQPASKLTLKVGEEKLKYLFSMGFWEMSGRAGSRNLPGQLGAVEAFSYYVSKEEPPHIGKL